MPVYSVFAAVAIAKSCELGGGIYSSLGRMECWMHTKDICTGRPSTASPIICQQCWAKSTEEHREAIKQMHNSTSAHIFCKMRGCWEVAHRRNFVQKEGVCRSHANESQATHANESQASSRRVRFQNGPPEARDRSRSPPCARTSSPPRTSTEITVTREKMSQLLTYVQQWKARIEVTEARLEALKSRCA